MERLDRRDCEIRCITAAVLIGQIKLTRIHVLSLFLPGVRVKRDKEASLYDVERSGRGAFAGTTQPNLLFSRDVYSVFAVVSPGNGGARRDRTDDILLAKQALSQLSYGPTAVTQTYVRDRVCFASGPFEQSSHGLLAFNQSTGLIDLPCGKPAAKWWARVDSNYRPHAYQACALTT